MQSFDFIPHDIRILFAVISMPQVPISARWASIALILEPKIEVLFWLVLSVIFVFVLGISDTGGVANYPWWAVIRVSLGAAYPLLTKCNAIVRWRARGIARREMQILSEIWMTLRRSPISHIWAVVSAGLKTFGGPQTKKDAREIYRMVADPKTVAEAKNKLLSFTIWALLVTALFRFDSPFLLPQSHRLMKLVYPTPENLWVHMVHITWIVASQSKNIQMIQLEFLLRIQSGILALISMINDVIENCLAVLIENSDRFFWILGKTISSLMGQLVFEIFFAGLYRLWQGPVENWDLSGRNFYLAIKFLMLLQSIWGGRRQFPPRGNIPTNWANREKYSYTSLQNGTASNNESSSNEESRGIRLLVLHPRLSVSDIRCTLFEVPLNKAPSYETISHTMVAPGLNKYIGVNGKRLNIPISLYSVLSSHSSMWRPKILWIDAVCINQEDEAERRDQVGLRGEVFKNAFVVSK